MTFYEFTLAFVDENNIYGAISRKLHNAVKEGDPVAELKDCNELLYSYLESNMLDVDFYRAFKDMWSEYCGCVYCAYCGHGIGGAVARAICRLNDRKSSCALTIYTELPGRGVLKDVFGEVLRNIYGDSVPMPNGAMLTLLIAGPDNYEELTGNNAPKFYEIKHYNEYTKVLKKIFGETKIPRVGCVPTNDIFEQILRASKTCGVSESGS